MLKAGARSIITLLTIFVLSTCIEPYAPEIYGYASLLVVDGLITNENSSYTVKLSRTMQENISPEIVTDAVLFITDDSGNNFPLGNFGDGIYKTDSTQFTGIIGRTYTLNIITSEGEVYKSDPCLMYDVPGIDSVFFEKDEELVNNGTENTAGIRIYVRSEEGYDARYYRWDFEETWKFKIPNPSKLIYFSQLNIQPNPDVREYCWKNRKSDEILINRIYKGDSKRIEKMPVTFIASDKSDRLLLHYSILIRQFSVSQKEYEFWYNLSKVNKMGGDIFAAQPYSVTSNLHSENDPDKRVLGYFQVSAVSQKRKEIPFSEIVGLDLPFYHYPCIRIEDSPYIPPWSNYSPPLTWDDLHYMYTTSGYTFVEPKYIHATLILDRLVFTKIECSDCAMTGTITKPDFWVDMN